MGHVGVPSAPGGLHFPARPAGAGDAGEGGAASCCCCVVRGGGERSRAAGRGARAESRLRSAFRTA
ncbi:spondin-2 [Platysternon megacephalum]|uniref:Spondin-2 n=1 Tax=Platysternon megacephalum TaxID=55544 RepID=A0A4D9EKV4_9SAUR|nr:spondin-2 [Platysternon megacephalum]